MATVLERVTARATSGGSAPSHKREFVITDAIDHTDAVTALLAAVPASVDVPRTTDSSLSVSLPLKDYSAEELEGDTETFFATVIWGQTGSGATNVTIPGLIAEAATQFATGGGTRHITHAKETVQSRGPLQSIGIDPPNHGTAINVADGKIAGVDIVVPQFRWTESYDFSSLQVTQAYIETLKFLTGKVCKQGWRDCNKREVLLANVVGRRDKNSVWRLDFEFWNEPSLSNQTIDDVTGIDKAGWDYLWVLTEEAPDNINIVHNAIGVYVNRVYDEGDFSLLGIGG